MSQSGTAKARTAGAVQVDGSDSHGSAQHGHPPIEEVSPGRTWALQTSGTSYLVGFTDEGYLVQHFWGASLDPGAYDSVLTDIRGRWNSSFQRPDEIAEQLPVDGGQRWGVPSLQVRFSGGVRALELAFEIAEIAHAANTHVLSIGLLDAVQEFAVILRYRTRDGSDVLERWVEVENRSSSRVAEVLRLDSANWLIADQQEYRATTFTGYWGAETQQQRSKLAIGEFGLASRQGTTGHGANPFALIDDGTATETAGETRSVALAWSGSWRLTMQRRPEGRAAVSIGFGQDGLIWPLGPGESLTAPPSFGLFSDGGFGRASNRWHDFVRDHVLSHGREDRPVVYNSWEATGFEIDEQAEAELAHKAAALGVELFVMDDGWFSTRRNDQSGLGDWQPAAAPFPNGLGGLVDTVHGLGMGFGLWVEPEMVNEDSDLYRRNPDWILHWPDRTRFERRNQHILNFARPDVRKWAARWLTELVTENGIDFLKWDMNRPFTNAGWPEQGDRQDLLWIEHTRGIYEVIDSLRERHPALRIEACASGGARADMGILARTDQVWISDNTDALDRQVIQAGFNFMYPASTMGAWVTDETNLMTRRRIPLAYRFHVAMAGALGVGADLALWSAEELEFAKEQIELYKQIRPTIQHGDMQRLGGMPGRELSAIQFTSESEVVVFQYEPHRSLSAAPRHLKLRGLPGDARYRDEQSGDEFEASFLMNGGIRVLPDMTNRGWNNSRFSSSDYVSQITVLTRINASPRASAQ